MLIPTQFTIKPHGDDESVYFDVEVVTARPHQGFALDVRLFDTETMQEVGVSLRSVRVDGAMDFMTLNLSRELPEERIAYLVQQRDAIDEMLKTLGRA